MNDWMTVRQVAEYLQISHHTVYRYVSDRRIPHTKAPGSSLVRFSKKRIDEWVASGEVETVKNYLEGGAPNAQTAAPRRPRRQVRG